MFGSNFNIVSMPPPTAPNYITDSLKKRPSFSTFETSTVHKPQKALFTTFSSSNPGDKENFHPATIYSDQVTDISGPITDVKGPTKRALAEAAAAVKDRQLKKSKVQDPILFEVPKPDDMPAVEDDGLKPPYSYATLIGMSILRAPNRRLTLAQIYKWIESTFEYYNSSETGWQNSIRHNLSLNKAFKKQERPKDDPGKGNYWVIEPGMELQFLKDRPVKRPSAPQSTTAPPLDKKVALKPKMGLEILPDDAAHTPSSTRQEEGNPGIVEISSDATVPASDATILDEDLGSGTHLQPESPCAPRSSPPQINSSPPVVRRCNGQHGARGLTPPPLSAPPVSSGEARVRKRKASTMDDSGYFSSIGSSAVRPFSAASKAVFDQDSVEGLRVKHGRAEEEIARIRSTSQRSPSKPRGLAGEPVLHVAPSSPLRQLDSSLMLPQLTPATTFKQPARPHQSLSPNTSLRNHRDRIRELVGSPLRGAAGVHESVSWSPAFNLEDESYVFNENFNNSFYSNFDIFEDDTQFGMALTSTGSPEKKRPRLERASTTANMQSPSKSPSLSANWFELMQGDPFDSTFFQDENESLVEADILQGFQKIGAVQTDTSNPTNYSAPRPAIARSRTSRF
ncbi:MAG: hypothetical protein M1817_006495 [Caeruleum heppii]|nr:MAG: hypothetical protein M1817_006495 [Caeruleum heppii]